LLICLTAVLKNFIIDLKDFNHWLKTRRGEMYTLLIKNGIIIDGTGNPWFRGDVAIEGDTIKK